MGSLGTSLIAWLGLPALLYAGSVGIGLLLERLMTSRVPDALLAPVGFCVGVDQMRLDYVTSFRSIVQRRGPTASRPPASYELDFSNRW